ncbi:cupin domain-containing protein [Pedobacter sp. PWIIR3]
MNLREYIESGILELYALNLLTEQEKREVDEMLAVHMELGEELELIYMALEAYASSQVKTPGKGVKSRIMGALHNLQKEKNMRLTDLPLIDKFSDYTNWLSVISKYSDMEPDDSGSAIKVLRKDHRVTQLLVITSKDILEETHDDEYESLLLLEGECICAIEGEARIMIPGDFMEIPLNSVHHFNLVTPKVMAIVQYVKS